MRGRVYREYGAIAAHLGPDGTHHDCLDAHSWHVLLQSGGGQVLGCARYRAVDTRFGDLTVSRSALASSTRFGPLLKTVVESDLRCASEQKVRYGEAGMWALSPEVRHSAAAVNLALMTFVLAEYLGGGRGITTATTRHGSSSILRRLGGYHGHNLPAYYEPRYGCNIEVIFFNSKALKERHAARLDKLRAQFQNIDFVGGRSGRDEAEAASAISEGTGLLRLHEHLVQGGRPAPPTLDGFAGFLPVRSHGQSHTGAR